jgi:hypothetical protein
MADAPRITVEELKRRMDAGEDFTVIDVRKRGGAPGVGTLFRFPMLGAACCVSLYRNAMSTGRTSMEVMADLRI